MVIITVIRRTINNVSDPMFNHLILISGHQITT